MEQTASEEDLVQEAFGAYRAGRRDEAGMLFRQVLERNPDRLGALLMLGIILAEGEGADVAAAETLFRRCLELSPDNFLALNHLGQLHLGRGERLAAAALFERALAQNPGFAPAFANLGTALHGLGRRSAALVAFDRALALDPGLVTVHGRRGQVLADLGRWDEAAAAFRLAAAAAPEAATAWCNLAAACEQTNALDEAEEAARRALALAPADIDAHVQLAAILDRAGRQAEALGLFATAARLRGPTLVPCRAGPPQARILILGAPGGGNVPTRFLFDPERFETVTIHLPPAGHGESGTAGVGAAGCGIVFNAVGDGAADDPFLAQADAVLARLALPVLNPPARIPPTSRDRLPALLAGIPGLVVPDTRRVSRADLAGVMAGAAEPMLVRPVGSHGGRDLVKVHTAAEVVRYLAGTPHPAFFVSPYVDYRSPDGYHRKFRFLFVDRQVYPYHLAVHDDWLIHYFRAEMEEEAWMRDEEKAFLADAGAVFPPPLAAAVAAVARRLDLDYGGMDCALTRDGRVLVFEANACMLLSLPDGGEEGAPYKRRAAEAIRGAIARMVLGRLGGGRGAAPS